MPNNTIEFMGRINNININNKSTFITIEVADYPEDIREAKRLTNADPNMFLDITVREDV